MCYKEEHIKLKKHIFCLHDVISITIKIKNQYFKTGFN